MEGSRKLKTLTVTFITSASQKISLFAEFKQLSAIATG
jgi:hypothetical protein